jgi:hypothetical protein
MSWLQWQQWEEQQQQERRQRIKRQRQQQRRRLQQKGATLTRRQKQHLDALKHSFGGKKRSQPALPKRITSVVLGGAPGMGKRHGKRK